MLNAQMVLAFMCSLGAANIDKSKCEYLNKPRQFTTMEMVTTVPKASPMGDWILLNSHCKKDICLLVNPRSL